MNTKRLLTSLLLVAAAGAGAQTFTAYTSTDSLFWKKSKVSLQGKTARTPDMTVTANTAGKDTGHVFRAWGTCFNELDWDALNLLTRKEQEEVMSRIFAPDGDLKFTRGRISMNANDYSRSWYSCDDVAGDFQLRHFNIERDKQGIIPLIRAAQRYNPNMTFWVSPWSPPAWMKINQDYCVVSSKFNTQDARKDYLLFGTVGKIDEDEVKMAGQQQGKFPRQLAAQNYFIQDERYLKSYADMFCRFIDLYAEQNVPIDMVMYQNEAYSYTPYPGCPWTAEGTIRFNRTVVVAGNFEDTLQSLSVKVGTKYLNQSLQPHSFNTFVITGH